MTTAMVPIDAAQAPALLQQRRAQGLALNKAFSDNVRDAFPTISIKGKVWRVRISGQETPMIDPATRQPIQSLDVILVNASRYLSKTYYIKGYTEGDNNAPDCWSLDAVKPDPSVLKPVSPSCINCPMNAFGSKVTDNGKAAKACVDIRRMAVVMPHMLMAAEPMMLLMRVPQSSLKNLKGYADMLDRHGFEPGACVTRMSFDLDAFPKILFNFVAPLQADQYAKVVDLAEAPTTDQMLRTPDFDTAPSTAGSQQAAAASLQEQPVQQAPIIPGLTDAPIAATVALQQAPVQATMQSVASSVIELPDGKLFDTATGQYVERAQPDNMPMADPETIALPDGTFFNKTLRAYVTGPEKGAQAVEAPATTRTRKPRTPKEPPATKQAASGQPQADPVQAAPVMENQGSAPPDQSALLAAIAGGAVAAATTPQASPYPQAQAETPPPAQNGAAGAAPIVQGANMKLEDVLAKLVPPAN